MPRLDGKGPDNKGSKTGRGLGKCTSSSESSLLKRLGVGLGVRRKEGGGKGKGNRLQSGNK